ncbi:MAG: DUF192 domain-containing protein [Acidobacteria bacterium]|nr:DUF192 domain-containing protein [Acidobacteriota bacterium]
MVITRRSIAHTWSMRFPIDVVFLNEDARVVRIVERLRPFRVVWGGRSVLDTLKLPTSACHLAGLRAGDQLRIG